MDLPRNEWIGVGLNQLNVNTKTEQFISGLNEDGTIDEILKEVAKLEDIKDTRSECVLL